jgi:hypothetical protein
MIGRNIFPPSMDLGCLKFCGSPDPLQDILAGEGSNTLKALGITAGDLLWIMAPLPPDPHLLRAATATPVSVPGSSKRTCEDLEGPSSSVTIEHTFAAAMEVDHDTAAEDAGAAPTDDPPQVSRLEV